jgi:hypothetical protein
MDDLRSEIRAAFEKEQAGHAPAAALRRDVVEAVAARPRRERNFQWLAVAAGIVLGILVVVGLLSTRLAHRPVGQANPQATPQATPAGGDYGPPPAGVPLLYVHDPDHVKWLIAFDWTGHPRGTVKPDQALPANQAMALQQAPDGQTFLSAPAAKGGSPQFFDRLGREIPTPAGERFTGGIWADDYRHWCSVGFDQNTYVWTLVTQLSGEAARHVAVVAQDSGVGQTGISMAACSFANDQAILVRTSVSWPSELWVIKLSTGKVLSHHTYAVEMLAQVTASRDSLYIAESSSKSDGRLASSSASSTVYRRVSDWTVVLSRPATEGVLAMSEDGSLALVQALIDAQSRNQAIIDLRTGKEIWHGQGGSLSGYLAKPGGSDFALVYTLAGAQNPTPGDILIVHADGSVDKFPQRYLPTW